MGFDTLGDWLAGLDFGLMIGLDSCQFDMTYLPLQGSMTKYVCSSHSEGQHHKRTYQSSWSHVKLLVTCHSSSQSTDQSKSHGQAKVNGAENSAYY